MQTDQKYKMYLWKQKKEYYTEENGKILFKEDTPMEIIESYELWQKQMQKLNDFPTKRTSGLFSFLNMEYRTEVVRQYNLIVVTIPHIHQVLSFVKKFALPESSHRNFVH